MKYPKLKPHTPQVIEALSGGGGQKLRHVSVLWSRRGVEPAPAFHCRMWKQAAEVNPSTSGETDSRSRQRL